MASDNPNVGGNVIENRGNTPLFIVPDEAVMDQPWDAMPVKTDPAMIAREPVLIACSFQSL